MKTRTLHSIRLCVEELEGRVVPSTLVTSANWSGYSVATGAGAVSQVAGSWVVPDVASNVSGYSASWVGIDGAFSSTVEQTGTSSDFVNGQAHYYAWYEMYPAAPVTLTLTINPGNVISASVRYIDRGQFMLSLTNISTGASFSTTQASSQAQRSSAEWIEEAPSSWRGVLPLANFGTVNFSGANAIVSGTTGPADNPWSGSTLYQVDMVTKFGALKARPSELTDSGNPATSSFSVTWISSGSGGPGGGGHKSPNMPSSGASPTPITSSTTAAASLLVPIGLAAAPRQAPPALVGTQSSSITLASSSAIVLPAAGLSLSPPIFVHFGSGADDPLGPGVDERDTPQIPADRAAPMDAAAPSRPDGTSPSLESTPASPPQAGLEIGPAGDACLVDACWLTASTLESAPAAITGGQTDGRGSAYAAVVLTFVLDGAWAIAMQEARTNREKKEDKKRTRGVRRLAVGAHAVASR